MSTVLVFCAHPDDEILGCGGTMAAYAKEGKKVIVVLFSRGEGSHPWLQEKHLFDMRKQESLVAGHICGVSDTIFLGLADGKLLEEAKKPVVIERLKSIIKKYRPEKIFTHDPDDIHPDHRGVHKASMQAIEECAQLGKFKGDVYSFNIWFMKVRKRNSPKLVVDISKTFALKRKALKAFKSQKLSVYQLAPFVFVKAFLDGLDSDVKWAEMFYKLR